eukprot:2511569-Alexandrium_andersonii.AAC.1
MCIRDSPTARAPRKARLAKSEHPATRPRRLHSGQRRSKQCASQHLHTPKRRVRITATLRRQPSPERAR